MPTILKRIFQPKWQSSNPDTRLEAIDGLQWNQAEQRAALLHLAQKDPDTRVREKALSRIDDISVLVQMLPHTEGAAQQAVFKRLARLLERGLSVEAVRQQLSGIVDEQLRYRILKQAQQPELTLAILPDLKDSALLADIAMSASASRVRQAAVEALQDFARLEEVMKAAKNKDKGVYQIAKAKLSERKESERLAQQLQQQREDLCAALEAHATSEAAHLYEAKFEALLNQWKTVAGGADSDLAGRTERAIRAIGERIQRQKDEERRRVEQARQHEDLQQERLGTCETLEQSLESLRALQTPDRAALPGLDALVKTQENRWLEATRDLHVEKSEQKRYQQAMHLLRNYLGALQKFATNEGRIQELLSELRAESDDSSSQGATSRNLRQLLDDIHWPEEFPAPSLLQQAQDAIGHLREQRRQHAEDVRKVKEQLQHAIAQLEKELEERSLKNSSRLFKEVQRLAHQLPEAQAHDFQGKLKLLHGRLDELRDWQGFAIKPKQLELCERMEHLADQHLDPQVKAHRIKELQTEWRSLGGSSDQSLWSRFKAASDRAYEPCQIFFAEHDLLKQANLDKREMLCEQLQDFLDHINWQQVDWKAMDKISRKAREEWHRFYPVDHKRNKPLQKHFHKLIDELERHLGEERQRNAALKADIVQRAEALAQQDDARAAANSAKQLQKEWQAVGLTEHREDRQLWKAFRAACDRIFELLDSQRHHQQHEQQQRVAEAETIVSALEQMAASATVDQEQEFQHKLQEFKSVGPLPREAHQQLQERAQKAVAAVRRALESERLAQRLEQWNEIARQAEALARFEDAAVAGQALEHQPDLRLPEETPEPIRLALSRRAERTRTQAVASYDSQTRAARLCAIQAEILTGLDTPTADKDLRMEHQMERLSAGLGAGAAKRQPQEDMEEILANWYGLGPVEPSLRESVQQRLDRALAQLARL